MVEMTRVTVEMTNNDGCSNLSGFNQIFKTTFGKRGSIEVGFCLYKSPEMLEPVAFNHLEIGLNRLDTGYHLPMSS